MEATGIARYATEYGRSSPVRWVLDFVQSFMPRASEGTSMRAQAARLQDVFWEDRPVALAPRARAPRRTAAGLHQAELWGDAPSVDQVAPGATRLRRTAQHIERSIELPAIKSAPMVAMTEIYARSAVKAKEAALARREALPHAARPRQKQPAPMSRWLEASRVVDGVSSPLRVVDVPGRLSGAHFNLWKGRPVGTPFLMGN